MLNMRCVAFHSYGSHPLGLGQQLAIHNGQAKDWLRLPRGILLIRLIGLREVVSAPQLRHRLRHLRFALRRIMRPFAEVEVESYPLNLRSLAMRMWSNGQLPILSWPFCAILGPHADVALWAEQHMPGKS
jgi:hypothetical protein